VTAEKFDVEILIVRQVFELQAIPYESQHRWQREEELRKQLRFKFHPIEKEVKSIIKSTVRASSIVENTNSRLRSYFFLRKSFGQGSFRIVEILSQL
jgi:hypothetical protein